MIKLIDIVERISCRVREDGWGYAESVNAVCDGERMRKVEEFCRFYDAGMMSEMSAAREEYFDVGIFRDVLLGDG